MEYIVSAPREQIKEFITVLETIARGHMEFALRLIRGMTHG